MPARFALLSLVLLASQTAIAADAPNQCCAARLRAGGGRQKALLRCQARAAMTGAAVDPACVEAALAALARTFARIEDPAGVSCTSSADCCSGTTCTGGVCG